MSAKHTPGPWSQEVLGHTLRVVKTNETEFSDDIALLGDCRDEKHLANARLIAAAPELLASLRGLEDIAAACPELVATPAARAWLKDARAVIAKAEGRS